MRKGTNRGGNEGHCTCLVQVEVRHVVRDVEDKQIASLRALVAVCGLDGRPGRFKRAGVPPIRLRSILGVYTLGQRLLLGKKGVLLLRLFEGRIQREAWFDPQ